MPGPYKGFSSQHTTQQEHAKPRHQPSNTDQRARERLKNKAFQAKIKSSAFIAFGPTALHTIYQTFYPGFLVSFHLSSLTTATTIKTIPALYIVQKDRHCMPTADYYFTNIQPDPITIPPRIGNKLTQTTQQAAADDPIPQQLDTPKPGKTRAYPSMIAENQILVLDLTNSTITSDADLQTAFHSLNLSYMAEKNSPQKSLSMTTFQTVNHMMKKLISVYAHHKKREFTILSGDRHKPHKQHCHFPQPNVIPQWKGDQKENQR